MKKNKFNLKRLLGIAAMLVAGSVHGQTLPVTTGTTHCTVIQDDCVLGSQVEATFLINPGGSWLFDPDGTNEFRAIVRLYRGELTTGFLYTVVDETLYGTANSPIIYSPSGFSTPSFFSINPLFTVTQNGAYRARTTLQQRTLSNGWVDRFTTPLSPYYGVNDVTFETYGDGAELARIEEVNAASYFSYKINGKTVSTPAPHFITCASVPLMINNIVSGIGSPGASTLTVQKGSMIGNAFNPGLNPPVSVTVPSSNTDKNLTSLFSLSGYTGALKVTYQLPDDECNGVYTTVAKSMTITVATAAFLNDYQAPTGSAVVPSCPSTATAKPTSSTWNITSAMPSSTVMNTFRCQLKTASGWQGATSAGIADLTYAGDYSIDVYEVSPSTGARLAGAPSLFLKTGTAASSDQITFGDYGYSAGFNASNPPFYVGDPANALGAGSGYNYFRDFYEAARTNSVIVGNLTSFSARVFCVEVSQYPAGGCVVSKKSYFRIANNGLPSGSTARMATSASGETEEEYPSIEVYPNPTKGLLSIPMTKDDSNVSIHIIDNLGKEVLNLKEVKDGNINIEHLTAGIYFYTIHKNGSVYRGKVIKE